MLLYLLHHSKVINDIYYITSHILLTVNDLPQSWMAFSRAFALNTGYISQRLLLRLTAFHHTRCQ